MCAGSSRNVDSTVQATKMMTSWEWDESSQNTASESASQLWWTREQEATFLPAGACSHVNLSATRCSEAALANPPSRSKEVQASHDRGQVVGSTWHVADVKRPLKSVAKMVAAGNRVHLDSKDPRIVRAKGDVIPLRKAGLVFVIDLWVRKDATSQRLDFSLAGLSPEVCITDGQTIRPVRSEGLARGRKVPFWLKPFPVQTCAVFFLFTSVSGFVLSKCSQPSFVVSPPILMARVSDGTDIAGISFSSHFCEC